MWIYYFFAVIVVLQGLASLKGGYRFLKYVQRESKKPLSTFAPFATIVLPCRGLDQGLKENLSAYYLQQYPAYEIIFVIDKEDDPALQFINHARNQFPDQTFLKSRIVIAGEAVDCGQKVHNLRVAVSEASSSSKVFVFADSDARPNQGWLVSLVSPLEDERIGATTGYRWFVPEHGSFGSNLRAVWNASIASALGDRGDKNFCWGGATAIRCSTFEKLEVRERWKGTLSDDFALTRALREARMPIHFVPACLTASLEDCSLKGAIEFTTRQLKITRVYASHLWKAVLLGSTLFVSVFFGGIAIVITRAFLGLPYALPLAVLCLIFTLGAWKSYLRLRAVRFAMTSPMTERALRVRESSFAHLTLWPLCVGTLFV